MKFLMNSPHPQTMTVRYNLDADSVFNDRLENIVKYFNELCVKHGEDAYLSVDEGKYESAIFSIVTTRMETPEEVVDRLSLYKRSVK